MRIIPFTDRYYQKLLGVTRKMVDVRFTIRSVMVQCLHRLLIQADDHPTRFPTAKSGAIYSCNIRDGNFFSLQPSHSMRSWFSRSGASNGIQWLASSICS